MHFKEDEKRTKMWNMMVNLLHWNVAEYEPYITTRLITANDLSAVRPLILQLAIGELRQPASRKYGTINALRG
jgi:cytochrome b